MCKCSIIWLQSCSPKTCKVKDERDSYWLLFLGREYRLAEKDLLDILLLLNNTFFKWPQIGPRLMFKSLKALFFLLHSFFISYSWDFRWWKRLGYKMDDAETSFCFDHHSNAQSMRVYLVCYLLMFPQINILFKSSINSFTIFGSLLVEY